MDNPLMIALCNSTFSMMMNRGDGDGGNNNFFTDSSSSSSSSSSTLFTMFGALAMGALVLVGRVSARSFSSAFKPRNLFDFYAIHHHSRVSSLLSSSSSSETNNLSVPGLRNVGNNCFLNAVLQALASCDVLLKYLDKERIFSACHVVEKNCPELPLTEALSELLRELSVVESQRRVVSPCRVMHALEPYAKQFDLAIQQDAAEALTHITSALHEEQLAFLRSCNPHDMCVDKNSFNGIHMQSNVSGKENNALQTCWPMEGTIGSMLTCQECGFQFATLFQSFNDVPLSPPLLPDGNIAEECNLEACLEQFTAPECITNVKCSYCSHVFALRLLHQKEKVNKDLSHRIQQCTFGDDCHCESAVMKEGETWKNVYVNALKQLRFDRSPEVICCHMQRVIVSNTGDLAKWKGRVKFPFVLNFFPYTLSAQGYTEQKYQSLASTPFHWMDHEEVLHKYVWHKIPQGNAPHLHRDPLSTSDESTSDDTHASSSTSDSEDLASEMSFESMVWRCENSEQEKYEEAYGCDRHDGPFSVHCDGRWNGSASFMLKDGAFEDRKAPYSCGYQADEDFAMESDTQDAVPMLSLPDALDETVHYEQGQDDKCKSKNWSYELVSVVVHDGSPGNGHYIVYRKTKLKKEKNPQKESNVQISQQDVDMEVESIEVQNVIALNTTDTVKWAGSMVLDSGCENDGRSSVNECEACPRYDRESKDLTLLSSSSSSSLMNSGCENDSRSSVNECEASPSSLGLEKGYSQGIQTLSFPMKSLRDCIAEDESVRWFRVSDSQVDLVTEQDVMMAEATLLFYERCS